MIFKNAATRIISCALVCLCLLCACADNADGLRDGYYMAEAADFDEYGWKEYVVLCVSDGRIVSVDYDAKNETGFIKSWDMDYMRVMNTMDGTYPNEYARAYAQALLNRQSPKGVDAISGATTSHRTFCELASAAIERAKAGDRNVAYVAFDE